MSKKISEMTPTGEAPATSELALAYSGANYKITPNDLIKEADGVMRYDTGTSSGTFTTTNTFQDLDLSGAVGAQRTFVVMMVYGGSTAIQFFARPKGESIEGHVTAGDQGGLGASGGQMAGTTNGGLIITVTTDQNGFIQHYGNGTSTGINYKIISFQVLA